LIVQKQQPRTDRRAEGLRSLESEELAEILKTTIEVYKKLEASQLECEAKFKDSIENYRIKVEEMITKICEHYQACLDTRNKKIAEYKKLEDQRDTEKERMDEDIKEVSV